jgi:TniQ
MYFPTPYDDELTGSLLIRASHHLGLAPRALVTVLTGKKVAARDFSFLIPAALPLLARYCYIDPWHLLLRHTVYPYVRLAFGKSRVLETELRLTSSPSVNHQFRLNTIYPQHVSITPFRRFCDECCAEDLRKFGESYWHVSHALPAVAVCPRHGQMLRVCSTRLLGIPTPSFNFLPHEAAGEISSLCGSHEVLVAIARESVFSLQTDHNLQEDIRSSYRTLGAALGYDLFDETRMSSGERLIRDLEAHFSEPLLRALGLSVRLESPIAWPFSAWPFSLMCGRNCAPQAQLKHILMRVFLKHRASDALSASKNEFPLA